MQECFSPFTQFIFNFILFESENKENAQVRHRNRDLFKTTPNVQELDY